MPQLPFGFDPDSGTFSNVRLPPPRVNNRYTSPSPTYTPASDTSYRYVRRELNWWERFDNFISNIGNWFAENFDDVVEKLSAGLYFIIIIGAAIAVIGTWINSGFWSAVGVGIVCLIVVGLLFWIGAIILPIATGIIMFTGRFIFWNAITLLIFLSVVIGGWIYTSFRPAPARETTEVVASQDSHQTYVCTARVLNVRSEASTNGNIIGTLRKGDQIKVTGTQGDFSSIEYKGRTGYVATRYLKQVEEIETNK
ncbi:MAG: SH3 domain-containing protein [Muribaculaceae bacterium]